MSEKQSVHLQETHPEWSHRMCVIAARYYSGVESLTALSARADLQRIFGGHRLRPLLTNSEVNAILRSRP